MGCHTPPIPDPAAKVLWLTIPEICPPGEGTALQIDKIFWKTEQVSWLQPREQCWPGCCGTKWRER